MSLDLLDLLGGGGGLEGRVFGVVTGTVTDNRDPEGLGRVKVAFPWLGEEGGTWWARVAAPGAAVARGAWFLPEVDDEVLVAFEHGDTRFPYVLGGLWNQNQTPPEDTDDGGADRRSITSRSGHIIRLDDTDGDERIEIVDKTGTNSIVITASDNSIEIAADGDIRIVSASGNVSIEGADVEITASGSAALTAGGNLDLQGDGPTTLKGSTVEIN